VVAVLAACSSSATQPQPQPAASSGSHHLTSKTIDQLSKTELIARILGVNAHVIVLKSQATFPEYRDVLASVEKTAGVVAAEPFIFVELLASSDKVHDVSIALKGVDPKRVRGVLDISSHITAGSIAALDDSTPAILVGDLLADTLKVGVGDRVTLGSPQNVESPGPPKQFRVRGIFHTDFDEYDRRLAYASLAATQDIVGRGDQAMGIEARTNDPDRAGAIGDAIEKTLGGPPYQVMDWKELNQGALGP